MAAEILDAHPDRVANLTLIPSSGGRYEISANGETIFSKAAVGRHAEDGEVLSLLQQKLGWAQS